jgi:lipopolysaccharide/colanic/teichoic acid biosynthesis glycosyltransferase
MDKRFSLKGSLLQYILLSCIGTFFSILLLRWISVPEYGFTRHMLIAMASAAVFTLIGLLISGSSRHIREDASFWNFRRIAATVMIKEVGMLAMMLSGWIGHHSAVHILLGIFSDIVFSIALIIYPSIIAARIRKESKDMHSIGDRINALVYGDGEDAADMAESAELSGRYEVLGLISRNPDMNGKILREYVIYYVGSEQDLEVLQWRLGGIDCILFPKGGQSDNSDANMWRGPVSPENIPQPKDSMSLSGKFIKRAFDLTLSGLLLIVFSPLFLLSALAVLIDDGRPVIYKQERIGRGGKPFYIYKFRSMRKDAEAAGPVLYSGITDPRLTRSGSFMRQHHLDELPQLWNVFRGDMSFIGYRPERQFYIDRIMADNPRYRFLYQIRPGVTSYATLYNGYTDTKEKMLTRLDMDLYYLRNHSVWFDLRILGLTFLSIVGGKKF